MPIDDREYPKNWKWLSDQVRKRNGGRCELCYAPNGSTVMRGKHLDHPWVQSTPGIKIILTVHHIDGDKKNNSEQNLISCCQKCHLRLDIGKHMKNRSRKSAPLFDKAPSGGKE